METLDNMAKNDNVVWMPHSATEVGAMIGGFKKLIESGPVASGETAGAS